MKRYHLSVLLLIGSADIALAQSTSNIPPTVGAARRINPGAGVERRIGIRAAVEGSYDTNVFGVSGAREDQVLRGRSKDDFSITPSVQLDIALPLGRNSVYLQGLIGYDFYMSNSSLNRERINLNGGGTFQPLNSCSVSPNVSYGRFRSNAGDVFIVAGDPTRARRNVQENTTFGAQASCARPSGLSLQAGYNHSSFRNSTTLFQQNDLNQDAFNGSIGYQRPSLGRVAIYGNYAEVEYLNRFDFFGQRDALRSYGAGLQFERNIGSRASASISAGYSWVEPRSNTGKFKGTSYSASLNLRPTDRLSIDLLASRSVDFANTFLASYSITEVYALNGTYRLARKLAFNFGTSHQTRDFRFSFPQGPGGPAFNFPVSSDTFDRTYGGVGYDLNRRLRLNALISHQKRNSKTVGTGNNVDLDFSNTTVSIGASLALGR